jgi:hypothetical protein
MYFSFVPEFFKLVVIHSCCIVCIVDGLLLSLSCIVFSMLVGRIDCDYSSHRICERFAMCRGITLLVGCLQAVQSHGRRSLSLYYHEDVCSLRWCISLR